MIKQYLSNKGSGTLYSPVMFMSLLLLVFSAATEAQDGGTLFDYVRNADVTADQRAQIDLYMDDPTAVRVWVIQINPDRIKQGDRLDVNLYGGEDIQLNSLRKVERSTSDYSLTGVTDEQDSEVALVVQDGDVVGTIRKGNNLYSIRPLPNGMAALILRDQTAFPPDHPPEFEQEMERRMQERDDLPRLKEMLDESKLIDTGATIDILVAWTPAARRQAGNINALIQLAIDETNQSYQNSRINPRLRLVHSYETNYTEANNNMRLDRDRFRITNDGFMDEVHTRRNQHRADMAVLITRNGNYCGIAADIFAEPDTAFAVVGQNCATGYYSFGHELGHLQGARHNPEADSSTTPFRYGHGFCYPNGNWRTVMSYNNNCASRLQNWSNPSVRRSNVTMGSSATHDNARVLNGTAPYIANFRTAAQTPCRTGFQPAGSRLCISVNAHSAQSYANAMVYCRDRRSRVASYGDLRYLYVRTAVDAAYNPNGRWIGNFVDDDRALCGNKAVTYDNDPDIGNFEGKCSRFDNRSFWCAYDR